MDKSTNMAKVPPPPNIAKTDPVLNRWLLELTSILNGAGQVDPGSVVGLAALVAQVNAQGAAITALNTLTASQAASITALNTLTATHTTQITALTSRAQVFNGIGAPAAGLGAVNDWYANTAGAAGARIYIKTSPGVWTAFPF